jgi:type II secretory pathway predicted ATPase ExeA
MPAWHRRGRTVYRDHFSLRERPFNHAPGKHFFAASTAVTEAVARLQDVFTARDSIAVVSGGPGVGKTTLVECALAALSGRVTAARVDLRYGEPDDLYGAILLALGEEANGLRPVQGLNALRRKMEHLVREDQRLVLCLDIGGISTDVAKHLLRVVNLAGEHDCQMNVALMGPHPLHQQLDLPALIQLRQRIAFRHRARPLTLSDTDRYLRHQIEAAGGDPTSLVSSNVSAAVYCYVAGVPRLVNTLMDAAFAEAFMQKLPRPDSNVVRRSAESLGWKPMTPSQSAGDAPKPGGTAARPTPPRSFPPKVAIVSSSSMPARSPPAEKPAAAEVRSVDLPPPSEMTLALRKSADGDSGSTGKFAALSLASTGASPTAAVFGGGEPAARRAGGAPVIEMDSTDTSATGMLRLQDLDERFAETIFGKGAENERKRD